MNNLEEKYCKKCSKLLEPIKGITIPEELQDTCKCPKEENKQFLPFYNYGWICPVCGRGNSPHTHICPCKPIQLNIIY